MINENNQTTFKMHLLSELWTFSFKIFIDRRFSARNELLSWRVAAYILILLPIL